MSVMLLTEHHLEFLSLKGGCTGSSESTLVKMPHCWKSHVIAYIIEFQPVNSFLAREDFCHLLITFANNLDPDQDRQNISTDWDPNHLTLR